MSINLVEAVQAKLGCPALHKIDPNTQEIIKDDKPVDLLAQAAIPTVLIEMYKASTNEQQAANLLRENSSSSGAKDLFKDDYTSVVERVAAYSHKSVEEAGHEMDKVTHASHAVLRENLKGTDGKSVKSFFNSQIANLKKYIPGALHIGDALHDNTIDDRTHKMEGPMSDAMHAIERLFSDGTNQKKAFNPTDDTIHYKK
ncbi:hypothetical protein EXU57_21675 [Segetibacter sp. 3557_3]|uniref:hypothetical protein n=1 Tax=Segetibacter sp. 3557_3 TaxID=2547429 RepID=UPI00105894D5|nr:hypothetical protein [Segetibacter sp. 3557_3]TDH20046.1 hypothetical protein EXU57_21675 [Segetibacter sp. 3557_3]